jgi:hypothetical protein
MPSMQQFESTLVHDHTGISHRSTRILFGGMLAGATLYLYGLNALHESNSARLLKKSVSHCHSKSGPKAQTCDRLFTTTIGFTSFGLARS